MISAFLRYWEKLSQNIERLGFIGVLRKLLYIFSVKFCRISKIAIYEFELEKPPTKITPKIDLVYRLATINDVISMGEELGYGKKEKRFSIERLKKGDKGILALHKNQVVGYQWIMKEKMELSLNNHIVLPKSKVYVYKAFVKQEFRGKRISNLLDNYIFRNLKKKEGITYVFSNIAETNRPAIKARERIGWKIVGHIIQFRFFGLNYDYISKKDLGYLQNFQT